MPAALLYVYAALVGACVGSFLNVCVYRWPEGLSVVRPRSRCGSCGTQLGWRDNIPVLGWIFLRGRCRYCGAKVSIQYPLVELATALIWLGAAWYLGFTLQALALAIFLTILLGISLTDVATYTIPHEFTMGGAVLGFLFSFAPGGTTPLQAVLGWITGFGILWIVGTVVTWWMKRNGRLPEDLDSALGGGDLWMMGMAGAFLGPLGVMMTIFLGAIAGLVVFVPIQLATGKKMIPFGVFLAAGAAIASVWGPAIVRWYVSYATGG